MTNVYPVSDFPHAELLIKNAAAIVADGRGILAADESTGTIGKRLAAIGVENTLENRVRWRELLFTSPGEWNKHIGGVITYEETLLGTGSDGQSLVKPLLDRGVLVGIKTDKGVRPLLQTDGETVTQGIDGMAERCAKYFEAGARFVKWRAVIKVNEGTLPTENAIHQNAYTLARYAAISQAAGLVPIVEPEVLVLDGSHDIVRSAKVTHAVIAACYKELHNQNVLLEGTLLKPNMVMGGKEAGENTPEEVARYTMRVLRNTVPASVPGIVFLSGGQSESQATANLNAINRVEGPKPWAVTFSFGRALQGSALKAWQGKDENKAAAQEAWLKLAEANSLASQGKFTGTAGSSESLYIKSYVY